MINNPNPATGYSVHQIVDSTIDAAAATLEIVVGSWPDEATSHRPFVSRTIKVAFDQWQPEYYHDMEAMVNAHPDWIAQAPERTGPHDVLKLPQRTWIDLRALSDVKAARWAAIKVARDAAITKPLVTPYGTFDATPVAQKSITDAVLMLQTLQAMGTPETIDFTLANNTTVTLTTEQMVNVGLLLGAQTQAAYTMGRGLRVQIEAATSIAQVEAITWPT